MSLIDNIQAEAKNLGLDLFGSTTPAPPSSFPIFHQWLEAGRHADMAYLASDHSREFRSQPQRILEGCQAILIFGMPYNNPLINHNTPPQDCHVYGRIAAYAWGEDYHHIIPERLEKLIIQIESLAQQSQILRMPDSIQHKIYTDTGAILEHDLAQRAGLGWIGKNTSLISPQHGSFFFLAELFTNLPLESTPQFTADRCGTCQRCIKTCPTQCILPDRTIDANHCISYLTIENKGPIPHELRSKMGNWIFGCDQCQLLCPWNQIQEKSIEVDVAFSPLPGFPYPDLIHEINLTPEAFNRKFRRHPIKRAKRRGYLRNVAVALGNSKNSQAVPALVQSLEGEFEPLVRGHTAWALGQIRTPASLHALNRARNSETDPYVLSEIEHALSH